MNKAQAKIFFLWFYIALKYLIIIIVFYSIILYVCMNNNSFYHENKYGSTQIISKNIFFYIYEITNGSIAVFKWVN